MEKQNNHEFGTTDPDFIDQNTLVGGDKIQSDDQYQHEVKKVDIPEFGESDPDYIEQNTLVDNDNYARDEDPFEYQEGFIEDFKHPENNFQINRDSNQENKLDENKLNKEKIINKNEAVTNDENKNDLNSENDK